MLNVKNYTKGQNLCSTNADCVEVAAQMPEKPVDFIIYSPPFASLYTYSNDERDMGNCGSDSEFSAILAIWRSPCTGCSSRDA